MKLESWQQDFVERVGLLGEPTGLPPSFVRVFAYMIVCEPAHQSVEQIQETLELSPGAISMATSALVRMGFAERISVPGERRKYLRFHPNAWERMLRLRVDAAAQMQVLADAAIGSAADPPQRLIEMRDLYAWFVKELSDSVAETPWLGNGSGKGLR